MKKVLSLILAIIISCSMTGCALLSAISDPISLYDTEWMIGKNSDEIQKRYGKFDGGDGPSDGSLYKNCLGIYFLKIDHYDLFGGRMPNEKLYIHFDADGIAYKVHKQVDEGG